MPQKQRIKADLKATAWSNSGNFPRRDQEIHQIPSHFKTTTNLHKASNQLINKDFISTQRTGTQFAPVDMHSLKTG